jgi:hypothetical protein
MLPRTTMTARWRRFGLWTFAALVASCAISARRGFQHGGSPMGIVYGALGLLAILVLLYFGVRKRSYRSTWGTLDGWLQSHIYIGLLSAVVIVLHTGLRFHDRVAVAAFATLLVVVASGVVGASLYSSVPRRLSEVESDLTPEEISAQVKQLADSMARLAASRSRPFQQVCQGLIAESVPGRMAGWKLMLDRRGTERRPQATALGAPASAGQPAPWAAHLARVPGGEQEDLRQLLVLSRQRRELLEQLVAQQRYRNLLGAWLYLHVPLSIALLALVTAHLLAVFYFWRP